jgi:hypothetical protein
MWEYIKSIFTKDFWVGPFPKHYADECFDCKLTDCEGCKFKESNISD